MAKYWMLVGPFGILLTFRFVRSANKAATLADWSPEDDDVLSMLQLSLLQHRTSNGSSRATEGKGLKSQRFKSNLRDSLASLPFEFRKTGARQGVAPIGTTIRQTLGQKLTFAHHKNSEILSGTPSSHVSTYRSNGEGKNVSLEQFLQERLMGKHFTYVVNGGNAGDALIQHGTMLLFDKLGLTFDVGRNYHNAYTNTTLVYAGAGNLVQSNKFEYHGCANFLRHNTPIAQGNTIVLLPATIHGYSDLLGSLGSNVVIFTRERMTYDYVVNSQAKATVFLSHDMAFYIDKLDPDLPALRAHALRRRSWPTPPSERKQRGFMLRTDDESDASQHIPPGNRDVSAEGKVFFINSVAEFKQHVRNLSHYVMEAVGNCSEVWTDRLHLCIASCLVGTQVHCMDNVYGKNQAVFEHSINGQYPNAVWEGNLVSNIQMGSSTNRTLAIVSNIQMGSSTNHLFKITCCVVAAVSMLGLRVLERLVECRHLGTLVMAADVMAWYVMTSVYLAACQDLLLKLSSGLATIIITMIQVSSGLVILPFGDLRNLNEISGHYLMILAGCGSAFYFSSYFVLEGLRHAGMIMVSNVRALEPFSTTLIMVMFGGSSLSHLQYMSILIAVFGVLVAGNRPEQTAKLSGLLIVVILLCSNVLNSLRNIFIQQATELGFAYKSKITVWVICSFMALPLSGIMLVLGHFANLSHPMISSVFMDPLLLVTSLSFTLYNVASFLVLMRVKPVAHVVLLSGKRVVSVLLACAFAHHFPSNIEVLGMCITVVGVAVFEVEKRKLSLNNAAECSTDVYACLKDKATVANAAETEAGSMIKQLLLSRMKFTIILSFLTIACIGMAFYLCASQT